MRLRPSTGSWLSLKHGPWPKAVTERLETALDALARRLREHASVAGVVLFGSYARGEAGRSSDVDLLILLDGASQSDPAVAGRAVLDLVGAVEVEFRVPMHLAPLLADAHHPERLGHDLLHAVWTDGLILYARAGVLAMLQPAGLAPWTVFRFSAAHTRPAERVRLSRRLHGRRGQPGAVRPPGLTLGAGALLVPAPQQTAVRSALDEAGARYDAITVWRESDRPEGEATG